MKKILKVVLSLSVILSAGDAVKGRESGEKLLGKLNMKDLNDFRYKNLPKKYKHLPALIKKINDKKPILTINYLTSSSVPVTSHLVFSTQSRKLKESFNIQTKMCMNGIEGKEFREFIPKLMEELDKTGEYEQGMDFCPQLFEDLEIKRVPAYLISVCPNEYTHPEECEQRYLIRGDVSLQFALEKLSEQNQYFKDMYEAL